MSVAVDQAGQDDPPTRVNPAPRKKPLFQLSARPNSNNHIAANRYGAVVKHAPLGTHSDDGAA
jgi:hypothetical protein